MNDLNTIARLNSEATERDIPAQQANGKYVVAEYAGLHFTSYKTFDTEVEANAYACQVGNEVGRRSRVYAALQPLIGDPADTPVFEIRRAPDGDGVVGSPVVTADFSTDTPSGLGGLID